MESILGFLAPGIVYFYLFILNAIVPGRWVIGYVTKTGTDEKLKYRLNGLLVLFVAVATWIGLCYAELLAWDWFYIVRWPALAGAIVFGLVFSFAIVIPYPKVRNNFLIDFFLGRLDNPQLWGGRIDAKMYLYLIGAIMLEINILSFLAHHYLLYGAESNLGLFVAAGLLTYFIIDYLTFEEVHLYTYDFFAEKVGFKLGWGCIAFYPFFYTIPFWSTAVMPSPNQSPFLIALGALIFFVFWGLSRGANLQKYFFKRDPNESFLGIKPESITDGKKTLLVNGFWGLSRHINYLGEIGMATGIIVAVGHLLLPWPWLYPLYYVALLFPRQIDDDKRCEAKYGPLWQEYLKKVPYRIIPGVY
jgi:delta14-sterol reductase